MTYGNVSMDVMQTSDGASLGAGNASIMKNRLINGACVIDQRNAGASVTPSGAPIIQYTLDRWCLSIAQSSKLSVQQNAGSVTPPAGFTNYLGVTSTSAFTPASTDYFQLIQNIEGFNIADLGWGTSAAKTVTLSFWVYSSLTGQFGGTIRNSPNFTYTYPFSFTISSANTWQQVNITIVGPNASQGVWNTTNTTGLQLVFDMGCGSTFLSTANSWQAGTFAGVTGDTKIVGTSGATFYITGCQLERGSSATGYEYVNYQTSLANCQRYCYTFVGAGGYSSMPLVGFVQASGNTARLETTFPVTMRTAPSLTTPAANTIIIQGPSGTNYTPTVLALTTSSAQTQSAFVDATVSGQANYSCVVFDNNSTASKFIFSAEL